jgi:hypothetical protein
MELEFLDMTLIVRAADIILPRDFKDEALFLTVKPGLISLLHDSSTEVIHFGPAPDNITDGQDDLINEGTFFRIICSEKYLGIDIYTPYDEVFAAFLNVIEHYNPFWSNVIVEKGFIKTETTIELLYGEVF